MKLKTFALILLTIIIFSGGCAEHNGVASLVSLKPNAPVDLELTQIGDTQVLLSWHDTSTMEDGFRIYVSTGSTKPANPNTELPADKETYTLTGLTPGTTYHIWLESYNENGSEGHLYAYITAGAPLPPLDASYFYTGGLMTVSWMDGSTNEQGFRVYTSQLNQKPASETADTAADIESTDISGLSAGAFYFIWVVSYNAYGESTAVKVSGIAEEPLWHDEFDGTSVNTADWNIIDAGGGFGNAELQYYSPRPENLNVSNGYLWITARQESYNGHGYTSAKLETQGKQTFTHCRVEARIKLPYGRGTWPAFWMLGQNIGSVGWPRCGEIDIMEHVGYDMDHIHGTVHTDDYNHMLGTQKGGSTIADDVDDRFYLFAIEWTSAKIDWYVDNEKYYSFSKAEWGDTFGQWPFDEPHFLILNLAIGGTWGGAQGVDNSIFPQTMVVDYVRVYQR